MAVASEPELFEAGEVNQLAFRYHGSLGSVQDFVLKNYSRKITLAAAARVARMERTYFSSFFHSKVGVPFRDWLRAFRIMKAQQLLRESNQTIHRVARDVGFEQLRSFERAFKKTTCLTPVQFKRAVRPR